MTIRSENSLIARSAPMVFLVHYNDPVTLNKLGALFNKDGFTQAYDEEVMAKLYTKDQIRVYVAQEPILETRFFVLANVHKDIENLTAVFVPEIFILTTPEGRLTATATMLHNEQPMLYVFDQIGHGDDLSLFPVIQGLAEQEGSIINQIRASKGQSLLPTTASEKTAVNLYKKLDVSDHGSPENIIFDLIQDHMKKGPHAHLVPIGRQTKYQL